jgi:hypothetical protein
VDKVNDDMIKKDDSERRAVAMVADEFQAGTRKDIFVNRETPRTPRQHRVGDLGGTRREPTAHDGSRTKYRAGSTGDTNLPAKGPHLYRVEAELKLLVLRLFVSLIYRPITNPANILSLFGEMFTISLLE